MACRSFDSEGWVEAGKIHDHSRGWNCGLFLFRREAFL